MNGIHEERFEKLGQFGNEMAGIRQRVKALMVADPNANLGDLLNKIDGAIAAAQDLYLDHRNFFAAEQAKADHGARVAAERLAAAKADAEAQAKADADTEAAQVRHHKRMKLLTEGAPKELLDRVRKANGFLEEARGICERLREGDPDVQPLLEGVSLAETHMKADLALLESVK